MEFDLMFEEAAPKHIFITGTRAYGPVSDISDLDIAMTKLDADVLEDFLRFVGIKTVHHKDINSAYEGFYFPLGEYDKVQIIVLENQNTFNKWYKATEAMKAIPPIYDRKERVKRFGEFLEV